MLRSRSREAPYLGAYTDATWQVFLNIVLDEAVEEKDGGEKVRLGMVVRIPFPDLCAVLRLIPW